MDGDILGLSRYSSTGFDECKGFLDLSRCRDTTRRRTESLSSLLSTALAPPARRTARFTLSLETSWLVSRDKYNAASRTEPCWR